MEVLIHKNPTKMKKEPIYKKKTQILPPFEGKRVYSARHQEASGNNFRQSFKGVNRNTNSIPKGTEGNRVQSPIYN